MIRRALPVIVAMFYCWLLGWLPAEAVLAPVALLMPPLFEFGCDGRCNGAAPASFQVDIGGFTDGTCTTCDTNYNGSFIVGNYDHGAPDYCSWLMLFPTYCTVGLAEIRFLDIQISGSDPYTITVQIRSNGPPFIHYVWLLGGITPQPYCASISGLAIPYSSGWTNLVTANCVGDGSDAILTAL